MTIAIDFDGTVVKHRYPNIGESIGAEVVLKELVKAGHRLILYTMRDHDTHEVPERSGLVSTTGDCLQAAVDWFYKKGIRLWGVNCNPTQKAWTSSPKVHADLYIDDRAFGVPLKTDPETGGYYVDWVKIAQVFALKGILSMEAYSRIQNSTAFV